MTSSVIDWELKMQRRMSRERTNGRKEGLKEGIKEFIHFSLTRNDGMKFWKRRKKNQKSKLKIPKSYE